MHVTFYGAVREVTGSMHLISSETDRVLLDCGLFQGRRRESDRKNRTLPFDPRILTNVVLSHAHIDHSGRLPLLTQKDFAGRIICTRATAGACSYLLPDSARIQQSDAEYLNYKTVRSHLYDLKTSPRTKKVSQREVRRVKELLKSDHNRLNTEAIDELIEKYHLEAVRPLYTVADAEAALGYFDGYPYREPVAIGREMHCTFYDAGHILGSAVSIIRLREDGRDCTIGFSGDLGRFGIPILRDPTLNFAPEDAALDLLIMESTYGQRLHSTVADLKSTLKAALQDAIARGGTVLIPAFAYGRAQVLLYMLHLLYDEGALPRLPIYLDSPLGIKLTQVYAEHPEVYDREANELFLANGKNPFYFHHVNFVGSVEESMALMRDNRPAIVIAASGMCEAGRILHHLRYKIHDERNTILIVGYMAENTLGRRILEFGQAYEAAGRSGPAPVVKFLNKEYPLRARVVKLNGFSAHGDRGELMRFLQSSNLKIRRIALVHGEEVQSIAFADFLRSEGFDAFVPHVGESVRL